MERIVKRGSGWRLGWDATAPEYKGMVSGADWSLELTATEFQEFRRMVNQLANTLQQMAAELMDEEKITCELESELLWMSVEGYPHTYDLRFILRTGRRGEGAWPATAIAELVPALQTLQVF